jgi:DNA-binding transcriptional regulator YhcF (GntR family)
MARTQVAGAIIVDQLRDRIVSGLFLGQWQPGERLPSIRDIADAEQVDRKTAAAAYRRLQREGLVRVRARSGVYLRSDAQKETPVHPLHRLYRRWLENTYEGAHSLGLDTASILRILEAVTSVEQRRIPVVDIDWSQAETLAHELRERLGIRTVPYTLGEMDPRDPVIATAPFLITTPYHRGRLDEALGERPVIELILSRTFLQELGERSALGSLVIVAPTVSVAAQLRVALDRGQLANGNGHATVVVASEQGRLLQHVRDAACVFLWPGTPPWAARELESLDCVIPASCVSEESLVRVRVAILDTALRELGTRSQLSRSNAGEAPARTDSPAGAGSARG